MGIIRKVAVVISVVAVFLLGTEFMVRKRIDFIDVIVVKKDLSQRHKIKKEDITTIKTSRHLVPDDALLNIEEVEGLYVKMEHTLLKNQMIRTANVETLSESIDAPQLLLYENERVYALKKDVVGSAGASINRGSYVDVAVQNKKEEDYGIIIENVRVVGVKDRSGLDVEPGTSPHVILLAIKTDDLNALLQYEEEAKIVLLPRDFSNES